LKELDTELTSLQIAWQFNRSYRNTKKSTAISSRLSELYELDLVNRRRKYGSNGALLYRAKPDIDVNHGQALYDLALSNLEKTRAKIKGSTTNQTTWYRLKRTRRRF
jgi:hypothetical protein